MPVTMVQNECSKNTRIWAIGTLIADFQKITMSDGNILARVELRFTRHCNSKTYVSIQSDAQIREIPGLNDDPTSIVEWLGDLSYSASMGKESVIFFGQNKTHPDRRPVVFVLTMEENPDFKTQENDALVARISELEVVCTNLRAELEKATARSVESDETMLPTRTKRSFVGC